MKKVVVFRNDLLPCSETFIKEQSRSLTDWKPILVGYRLLEDGLDLDGLDTQVIPGATEGTMGRYALRLRHFLARPHAATVKTLRAIGAELVHAHFGTDATDIWPSVRAVGLPMVVTLHGYDINIHREWWLAGHGGLHRCVYPTRLLRLAQDPAVHFVAVSRAIKRRAIEYGIPKRKITLSYIGVDTERFKPGGLPIDQRQSRILFVGRMVDQKGPMLLIRAFSKVREQVPDAELVMIGAGPQLESAKQLARELDVPVEFMGTQDPDAVLAQLHLARVLCLPSITTKNGETEGFGMVMLEAQASGVPVVTSAQAGTAESIVDGHTGLSFNEREIPAMAQRLLCFIALEDKLVAASAAARRHALAGFDLRVCSARLENIYDRLASIENRK